jgi:hypothetical protein
MIKVETIIINKKNNPKKTPREIAKTRHIPVHTSSNEFSDKFSLFPSFLPYLPPKPPGDEIQEVVHRAQERWRRSSGGAGLGRTTLRGTRTIYKKSGVQRSLELAKASLSHEDNNN